MCVGFSNVKQPDRINNIAYDNETAKKPYGEIGQV
jgi:hypothetical protein